VLRGGISLYNPLVVDAVALKMAGHYVRARVLELIEGETLADRFV
jgi:hypothetical protein